MSYDVLSKNLKMLLYDVIQYLDQSNVSQFTQKILVHARAIDLILAKIIQLYDSLSETFFEILWHNGARYIDKSKISQFSKKHLLLEQYGPSLTQNYTTCINCSKNF